MVITSSTRKKLIAELYRIAKICSGANKEAAAKAIFDDLVPFIENDVGIDCADAIKSLQENKLSELPVMPLEAAVCDRLSPIMYSIGISVNELHLVRPMLIVLLRCVRRIQHVAREAEKRNVVLPIEYLVAIVTAYTHLIMYRGLENVVDDDGITRPRQTPEQSLLRAKRYSKYQVEMYDSKKYTTEQIVKMRQEKSK